MTRDAIEFDVRGIPAPQGSPRAIRAGDRAILVTEASAAFGAKGGKTSALAAWRHAIATEARAAMGNDPLLAGPVRVAVELRPKPRPQAHFLRSGLRADAPRWHTSKPDADKLARAVLDALTGVVYADDRQVALLVSGKRWPDVGEAPGARIRISRLEATR